MKTNHVLMIASCSGIFGVIMGVSGMSMAFVQSTASFPSIGNASRTERGIEAKVDLLQKIRAGRYGDATRALEAQLDNDLIGAGELARNGAALSQSTLRAVETERQARASSGYEPDNATVGAAVRDALRLMPRAETGSRATPVALEDGGR